MNRTWTSRVPGVWALDAGADGGIITATTVPLRRGVSVLTWQESDAASIVHVHDYDNGRAVAAVMQRGRMEHLEGTVGRLD